MTIEGVVLERWATQRQIAIRLPETYRKQVIAGDIGATYDFERSPCIDFGKFIARVPLAVLSPKSEEELVECLLFLGQERVAFKVRGQGHSSGGQSLIDDGVVIDTSLLTGIISDDLEGQRVTVQAGTEWMVVIRHLRAQNRHPLVTTSNWWTSVGGTISVGGFGDRSHRSGMQADMIDSIRIVTLDGECHEVGPGDDLFDYSLAACSPLGVISAVTLRTLAAPWTLQARVLSWPSMEAFLEDHYQLCQTSSYDMLRLRLKWAEPELSVAGVVGFFSEDAVDDTVLANRLSARLGRWESIDLYEHLSLKPTKRWRPYCPALEFLLPLPSGLAVLKELRQRIVSAGLEPYLIDGSMVLPMRSRSTLPLAPFPDSQETLMVAIRPEVSASQLEGFLPVMNDLGTFLLQNRATLYLMSIPIDQPGWVKMQFGEKFGRLVELKRRYDPEGLIKSGPGTLLVDLQEAL